MKPKKSPRHTWKMPNSMLMPIIAVASFSQLKPLNVVKYWLSWKPKYWLERKPKTIAEIDVSCHIFAALCTRPSGLVILAIQVTKSSDAMP